jgi:microcystin-dependent protein
MRRSLIVLLLSLMVLPAIPALAQEPFLGEIDLVAFNFPPKGFALCNGQLIPINQNQALFALLGTTYGGNGQTTFALPDLRGRRAIGFGQGSGLSNYTQGQTGGEESVSLTVGQLPAHTHTAEASSAPGTSPGPNANFWASQSQVFLYSNAPGGFTNMNPETIRSAGSSQPHDNMPPYLVLNYIIALQGIFPSQN